MNGFADFQYRGRAIWSLKGSSYGSHGLWGFWGLLLACLAFVLLQSVTDTAFGQDGSTIPLAFDMSEKNISVTTDFDGEHITIFGLAQPDDQILVRVQGPFKKVHMGFRDKVFGVNAVVEELVFDLVPQFHWLAGTKDALSREGGALLNPDSLFLIGENSVFPRLFEQGSGPDTEQESIHSPSASRAASATGTHPAVPSTEAFLASLYQELVDSDLFRPEVEPIYFPSDHLFRADINLPANSPTGVWRVTTFSRSASGQFARKEMRFHVEQEGFSAWVSRFSLKYRTPYALLVLAVATAAGLLAFWWGHRK